MYDDFKELLSAFNAHSVKRLQTFDRRSLPQPHVDSELDSLLFEA